MKAYYSLACFLMFCAWSCQSDSLNTTRFSRILEADSIMKWIPAEVDTTIIVRDNAGTALGFRQYILTIFNNQGMIYRDGETWRLQRFTKTAIDSLIKDDHAIDRWGRWAAIKDTNSIKTREEKFRNMAATFATADRIIVLKSKRTMYLQKKGRNIFQFKINLGRNPWGNKQMDNDLRTPEGIYHVDNKTYRNDKYYKSFWISYPDSADLVGALKRNVKPGAGVMIHGTPPDRVNAKDWTNGCIALNNNDIDTLFKYVISGTLINIQK